MSLFVFALALVGVFYPYNRGALYTALVVLYALTACIAGYVAASYYKQMEGTLWVRNILLTCFTYCGPFFVTFSVLNSVAIAYRVCVAVAVACGAVQNMEMVNFLLFQPAVWAKAVAGAANRNILRRSRMA